MFGLFEKKEEPVETKPEKRLARIIDLKNIGDDETPQWTSEGTTTE